MKNTFSRRNFVQSGALIAAASVTPGAIPLLAQPSQAAGKPLPIQLGVASYTFRNFTREKMIGFMKQLNVSALNGKDVKNNFRRHRGGEARALADYAPGGKKLHAAETIYFRRAKKNNFRS